MEQLSTNGENSELIARRQKVASFIQANLQPAKHLLEEGSLAELDEDVSQEAQNFAIFEHQLDAWGSLWDARKNGASKALVHLATGLGKTSVAVFDVIKFREEYRAEHGREPRILFTCHQNEILEQAAERFSAFIPDASQGFYNGEEKIRDADLTFATLQSLHGSLDSFDPEEYDYIIYDEAHHSKAETFEKVVTHFKPAFQLALTATPNRLDEENIRDLFGNEVYSKGLAEALAEDLLAKPDYHIVFDDAVKEAMESGFEGNTLKELNQLFANRPRNEVIAQNIKKEMERIGLEFGDVKTIVFCQDIEHAQEMAKLLDGEAYHSGIESKKELRKVLNDFRDGINQVICTRDMFNEGVDIPDARLLVFLRSTSSRTIFEQQLGRGLRKYPGKDVVSILDFVANVERIAMIQELAQGTRDYTQRQQYEVGEGSAGSMEGEDTLQIHTGHGEFDFDRLGINLLDKYNALKTPPPDGWVSIAVLAEQAGVGYDMVKTIVGRRNDIDTPLFSFGGTLGIGLSPEAQTIILEELALGTPDDGWQTASAVARELDVSRNAVKGAASRLNINGAYINERRSNGLYYTAEEVQLIKNELGEVETVPEGYYTISELSEDLQIDKNVLRTIVKQLDIPGTRMRPERGGVALHYSEVEKIAIANHHSESHQRSDGWSTTNAISRESGISPQLVKEIIEEKDIEGKMMKPRRGPISMHYSQDVKEMIKEEYAKIPNVPEDEGWITPTTLSKRISKSRGISTNNKLIVRTAEELGIVSQVYRASNGKPSSFYSPSDVEKILAKLGYQI